MKEVANTSRVGSERIILERKEQLNNIIVDSRGRPDYLAVNLYWDEFRSWHNPKKEYKNGNVIHLSKLHKKGIQGCYKDLAERHACSRETVRKKIVLLEEKGLVSRGFDRELHYGETLFNKLHIYVWRDTPYFYNPIGIDREEVGQLKPQTNHKYIAAKYGVSNASNNTRIVSNNDGIGIQQHEDTKLLRTSLREEKLPLSGVSSFSSSLTTTNSTVTAHEATPTPKPRIRIVAAMSERISTPSLEQSDLLCYPNGAASQPCSTKNERNEPGTKYHELNQIDQLETLAVSRYGDSHNAILGQSTVIPIDPSTSTLQKTQIANQAVRENRTTKPTKSAKIIALTPSQECEHYRNHQGRDVESRTEFTAVADILTFVDQLPTTSAELAHVEQSPIANRGILGQFPNNPQEENAMKAYDWDNPANKLDHAISQNFDTNTAQELTIHVGYDYVASENKMRLRFKKKLAISEQNKNRLKQLIKDVYGDDIEIVTAPQNGKKADVVKLPQVQEKFSSIEQNRPKIDDFSEKPLTQKVIKNLIEDKIEKVLIDRWFNSNKMKITEYESRITFECSDVVADQIINKFQSSLTESCKELRIELLFLVKNRFDEVRETKITEKGKW